MTDVKAEKGKKSVCAMIGWHLKICLLSVVLFSATDAWATSSSMSHSRQSLTALTKTFGFLMGQQATLSRIQRTYPSMATECEIARTTFNAAFPNVQKRLERELVAAFGNAGFDSFKASLEDKIKQSLETQKIDESLSADFLNTVMSRSIGKELDADIWKTMLAANYFERPVDEFLDGHVKRFSSDGSGKSLGARFTLKVPISWESADGVRPNVVTKWVSENGNGPNTVMVQVWSMGGEEVTAQDVREFATPASIKSLIPDIGEVISSKSFVHEGNPAVVMDYRMKVDRVGILRSTRAQSYMIYTKNAAINLTCMTVVAEANNSQVDAKFNPMKPVCLQIANSLTLFN